MTFDEAIKHAEEVSDYDCYSEEQIKCADEHRKLAEWLKELKQLREQTRWIPTSEELPEETGYYLWCAKGGEIQKDYYWNGHWKIAGEYGYEVIAWMPLPTPYKAESE